MPFYKANDSYNASLTGDYTVGDATLAVNNVPTNLPTIVTVARGTAKETRFYVTGAASNLLTGVTRKEGANENISSGVSVECMIDDDFVNQLESAVFTQSGLKNLVYAADGGSSDAYAITLPVAPSSYSDIVGLPISFKANTVNTGAATLNVNSLGAKTIKKKASEDLADGDIKAGQVLTVIYDGTNFQLQYEGLPELDTDGTLAANSDTKIPSQKAVKTYVDAASASVNGWVASSDTWVYASAASFTIAGVDRTAIYTKGTRLRFKQGGGYKYATVASSSFSTDTTVTIFVNSDYTIANAAITDNGYSYQISPQGYPTTFAYTPTATATSGTITSASATGEFSVIGNKVWMQSTIVITTNGTGSGAVNVTPPVAVATASKYYLYGRSQATGKMLYAQGESGGFQVRVYDNTYPGSDGAALVVQGDYIY